MHLLFYASQVDDTCYLVGPNQPEDEEDEIQDIYDFQNAEYLERLEKGCSFMPSARACGIMNAIRCAALTLCSPSDVVDNVPMYRLLCRYLGVEEVHSLPCASCELQSEFVFF